MSLKRFKVFKPKDFLKIVGLTLLIEIFYFGLYKETWDWTKIIGYTFGLTLYAALVLVWMGIEPEDNRVYYSDR